LKKKKKKKKKKNLVIRFPPCRFAVSWFSDQYSSKCAALVLCRRSSYITNQLNKEQFGQLNSNEKFSQHFSGKGLRAKHVAILTNAC